MLFAVNGWTRDSHTKESQIKRESFDISYVKNVKRWFKWTSWENIVTKGESERVAERNKLRG